MSKRGISGQPGCVLCFRHNFLFGTILVFWPRFARNCAKQEIMSKTQNTPRLARNTNFAQLRAARGCESVVLSVHMPKTRHSGRIFGRKTTRKGPKRNRIRIIETQQEIMCSDPCFCRFRADFRPIRRLGCRILAIRTYSTTI